jgi:polysaccharide biosynthesis transport protein
MNKPTNNDHDASHGDSWSNATEGPTLLGAAMRHWVLVLMVTAVWCAAAGVYLKFTPWSYTSAAKLSVESTGPRLAAGGGSALRSMFYASQQCEVIKSSPVLSDTLQRLNADDRTALAPAGDPIEFLKANLDVSASRKDDVITVGFDSPDPKLGARLVDAVVATYLERRSWQQQDTSKELLAILRKELATREAELTDKQKTLIAMNQESGLGWADEKGDLTMQQLARLYDALSKSEMATLDAQATYAAAKTMANDPARLRLFAESQGVGDRQPASDPVQTQLLAERSRLDMQLASLRQELSDEHPSVLDLKARLAVIATQLDQIAQQTQGAVAQSLDVLGQRLEVAKAREAHLRQDLKQQQEAGKQANATLARRAMLQAEFGQAQRLCDVLRSRIMDTSATQQASAMDVQVIEPVFTSSLPTSPKIGVYLATFGGVGLLLGSLLALRRERRPVQTTASAAPTADTQVVADAPVADDVPADAAPVLPATVSTKAGRLAKEPVKVTSRDN